ncbi:hypothetical protein [Dethiobacter alkaliphilus]|uniref:hypothetical protein n=1 Tax=Dethiobacter alkaliphilus TaxID=427926 RepID=UPI002226F225|nr:hypothetical protein [Dethiobacter alkaliphilus]MCW3490220.1 hypothetical protein [Dethiobacter alkaliphilus]
MHKKDYLNSPTVLSFVKWLTPLLDTAGLFVHQYVDRSSGRRWQCNSIYDAFCKYQWAFNFRDSNNLIQSGTTFSENTQALERLQKQLRSALLNNDANSLYTVTCMIFQWGGVSARNTDWASKNCSELLSIYRQGMHMLNPDQADDKGPFPSRFNSGMTKVYSLLLNDFIIYDSRVGAALGYLVVRYCRERGLGCVHHLLQFPWAAAKESNSVNPKMRNPSAGTLYIKQISNPQDHARWNLRASWLLNETVKFSKKFGRERDPLRSLEAALFMIGYDLGGSNNKQIQYMGGRTDRAGTDYPLSTHGKGYPFRVDFSMQSKTVVFSYPEKSNGWRRPVDKFTLDEIWQVCSYLQSNFKDAAFPLANSVDRLRTDSEKPGLGMAIRTLTNNVSKAQASSYLGPYLEAVGALELVTPRPAKWKLIVEPKNVIDLIYAYHDKN